MRHENLRLAARDWYADKTGEAASAYLAELDRAGLLPGVEPRQAQVKCYPIPAKGGRGAAKQSGPRAPNSPLSPLTPFELELTVAGFTSRILFSYGEPIALVDYTREGAKWAWSPTAAYSTTSRQHVARWLGGFGLVRSDAEELTTIQFADRLSAVLA